MNKGFTIAFLIFSLFFIFIRIRDTFFKDKVGRGVIKKKWTLHALTFIYSGVALAAFIEYFVVQRSINLLVSGIGLVLYITAVLLRNWAINTLGQYYSPHIQIKVNHMLIQDGPYKVVRHPIYLSIIFELLGAILIPNSYFSFVLALISYIPLLMVRLYYEEKELIEKFGEQYILYMNTTPALLPIRGLIKLLP
jgi:protein-S-isoprenylcysteine O-methyltransferase Ste14